MNDPVVLVDAIRTPIGKGRATGALAPLHPVDLLAAVLGPLVERTGIDPGAVEDVVVGCLSQVREQASNIGRSALLGAGFPESVPATTVERQCGSSLQALNFAAQGVAAGAYEVVVAAGVEHMSTVPLGSSRMGADADGPLVHARYPAGFVNQGVAAEMIAARWGISREGQDELAVLSQARAAAARDQGRFADEIVPVEVPAGDGAVTVVAADEGVRETTAEGLGRLRPAFEDPEVLGRFPDITWSVTAGNSSQVSDGAAATLLMPASRARARGLRPLARVVAAAAVGDDPLYKLTGAVPATRRVLDRAGLGVDDVDLFECNEAFAPVVLAWSRECGVDLDRVNVNGGAIALGHPVGAAGVRLTTTLAHELRRRGGRFGLVAMCEGAGMANALVIENVG